MEPFFKYLTPGEDDISWGLYLNVAGKASIQAGTEYPSPNHPTGYFFTWDQGRILHEYQIVYITEGTGIYEDANGTFPIRSGSLVIIQPGSWHRYEPDQSTGWTENYIGFNGLIAKHIFGTSPLSTLNPIVFIGNREEIIETYYQIYRFIQDEKPGFQQVSAGMVIKLLGYLVSVEKQLNFTESRIEKIIQKACFLIRENVEKEIDFKNYAECNNIAYSYFRRMFKIYTGLPPSRYQLSLRIIRSQELLLSTDKIMKEICYEVGFESEYYFSRIFKNKTGVSPSQFRNSAKINRGKK